MALRFQKAQRRQCRCALKASQSGLISITQGVNTSKTNAGVGRKNHTPRELEPTRRRKILLASRRQGASPWARPAGGRRSPGEAGAGRAPRASSSRSADAETALRPPGAPSLASELALPRCCHVCGSDAAAGAHLPRDFRPLHLDLPHGGASRSPPRRERQRQSEWAPGPAHRGQV